MLQKNKKITRSAYDSFRKILRTSKLSRLAPYDKYLSSFSEKLSKSIESSIKIKPDLLQGEQETAALASLKVGKKLKIPTIVDIHNIWPEELASAGYLKRDSDTFKNLMKIEKFIVQNADGIICVNDFMKEYVINNLDSDPQKIVVVPPGGEVLFDESKEKEENYNKKQKWIIYAGLVNPNAHVDLFVKSISNVFSKHQNTKFIISEKGNDISKIKSLCKSLPIKPEFYWYQSRDKARELLKKCHVAVLPSSNDIGRKLGTPLKLLEYMSFGIPIVANDIGSWSKIIDSEKIGILTDDDPQEFAKGICTLIEDENLYKNIRIKMIRLMKEKFNWKTNVEKILLPFYKRLLS